jgi:hypothetical protein
MVHHSQETPHRRSAALCALTRPEFCIIEGLTATAHGRFPATAWLDECLVPMDVLVGGQDTLAVDVIGARVLGHILAEVEHLRLCAEWGLGEGDIERVEVRGRPLSDLTVRLPHTLLRRFRPKGRWVVGRASARVEGCTGNSECIQEMLYNDHRGEGGWTLVCGAGFRDGDLDRWPGAILVVGPCACDEVGGALRRRYADRTLFLVPEHNGLMTNSRYQASLMGLTPVNMVPLHPPPFCLDAVSSQAAWPPGARAPTLGLDRPSRCY